MLYWIQWINTTSKLQVSTGIFYLLISRNILNRNFIWKKHHVNHPTLSEPFFSTYLSHLFAILCALCPDIFVHSFLLRWILTTTHTFVVSFLCLFLFFSLYFVFACFMIYLSFCFNECLCQRSALLHLNTEHPTKRL